MTDRRPASNLLIVVKPIEGEVFAAYVIIIQGYAIFRLVIIMTCVMKTLIL